VAVHDRRNPPDAQPPACPHLSRNDASERPTMKRMFVALGIFAALAQPALARG
jgi:hypothetical protein